VLIQIQVTGAPRWGTGFVADEGRVITNEHVVREARAVTVWVNGTAYRARVAAVDTARDLAALVLPDARLTLKPLTLAADAHGRQGDAVVILASRTEAIRGPAGQPLRGVRVWPVSGSVWGYTLLHWPGGGSDYDLRLMARAVPGDSGSPVLRLRDGAVIGILRGRTYPDSDGRSETAWAVPVEAAQALLARVREAGAPDSNRFYLERLSGRG
jgi:S1-C subfamily serine protease